ncbi:MAG: hypothetical protein K0U67_01750 [Actinomycetia bacterium]|nr:hypothetical protein [Actinomycetes bacterium]
MPEPEVVDSGPRWDDVVDVLCVGPGLGALAYGIGCAAADLDVILAEPPAEPDAVLVALLEAMTEDLGDPSPDPELAIGTVAPEPPPVASGRRATMKSPLDSPLEPFVGQRLRSWSARCLASPYGVMFTEVPDLLVPMRSATGASITAAILGNCRESVGAWLTSQADGYGLIAAGRMGELIAVDGRIAGAALHTASGPWLVRATAGIAISVGPTPPESPEPAAAHLEAGLEVAVVGRRFGRFARVELVRR